MMDPNDWSGRSATLSFSGETVGDTDSIKTRSFKNLRRDATADQLLAFAKAVSRLTPNGDNPVTVDVDDQFTLAG